MAEPVWPVTVQGLTYKDYRRENRPTLQMEQNLLNVWRLDLWPSWLLQIQPCWLVVFPFWFCLKIDGHGNPPGNYVLQIHSDFEALLHLQLFICLSNIITYEFVCIGNKWLLTSITWRKTGWLHLDWAPIQYATALHTQKTALTVNVLGLFPPEDGLNSFFFLTAQTHNRGRDGSNMAATVTSRPTCLGLSPVGHRTSVAKRI